MKYRLLTTFWYDEDDAGLVSRLERLFKLEFFQDTILGPKSVRLPTTRANLITVLQPEKEQTSDVRFVVQRGKKSLRGTISLTRNSAWVGSKFTSFLEMSFAIGNTWKGAIFRDVYELRDILLACVQVGPAPMGIIECGDESSDQLAANFERFRITDSMAVPITVEWVTVLHQDVVDRMRIDLRKAASKSDVSVGKQGDYWWIILTPEPFSFASASHKQRYDALRDALKLDAIHKKFPRK